MRGGRRSDALSQLIARGTNSPQTIETLPEIRDAGTNCSIVEAPLLGAYPPNSVAKVHPGKAPCLNQKSHSGKYQYRRAKAEQPQRSGLC